MVRRAMEMFWSGGTKPWSAFTPGSRGQQQRQRHLWLSNQQIWIWSCCNSAQQKPSGSWATFAMESEVQSVSVISVENRCDTHVRLAFTRIVVDRFESTSGGIGTSFAPSCKIARRSGSDLLWRCQSVERSPKSSITSNVRTSISWRALLVYFCSSFASENAFN